jgi:HJR/Mrr/RecB family endonuclease
MVQQECLEQAQYQGCYASVIDRLTHREMLGVLQTFPPGSKSVIVTSSELTSGARELAVEHGIQFIERVNFSAGIQRQL